MNRRSVLRWGGVLVILAIGIGVAVAVAGRKPTSAEVLGMVGEALRKSALEDRGEYARMDEAGTFWPDLDKVLPHCEDSELVRSYVTGRSGVRVCYFAPLAPTNAVAMEFLDAYEADPNIIHAKEMKPLDGKLVIRSSPDGRVYRESELARFYFGDGFERFFIWDIGNPAAAEHYRRYLPVMWEMPHGRNADEMGGWVLYADGSVKWMAYPSDYPMTRAVIERVERLMAPLPPGGGEARKVDAGPPAKQLRGKAWQSPVYDLAVRIADRLPMDFCKIVECEDAPGKRVNGALGYRITLEAGEGISPPKRSLVLVPDKYPYTRRGGGKTPGPFYLGHGSGYYWFAKDPPYAVIRELQAEFGLTGGDDLGNGMLCRLERPYRVGAEALFALAKEGPSAVRVLEDVLPMCNRAEVFAAMEKAGGPEAERFLREHFAADNPKSFENAVETVYGLGEARLHQLSPSRGLVEAAKQAIASCNDYELIAKHAMRLASMPYGKGGPTEFNELGKQLLDRLPEEMRKKVLN